ncbi:MAG: hypothetical protein ABIA59_10465 [Candidatus Latescibacterota bacterium]
MARFFTAVLFCSLVVLICSCGDEKDPLSVEVSISGKVTNNSGVVGAIIVEIDYYMRDTAEADGDYSINVHKDLFVDTLYAWVDVNRNASHDPGEPAGSYGTPFQVRGSNIGNVDFTIP